MKRMMIAVVLALTPMPAVAQAPDCGETCMLDLMTSYLDGLGVRDASQVPLAANHTVYENGKPSSTGTGIWTSGNGWTYRHTVADPQEQQAVTLGVIRDGDQPAFIAVRIAVEGKQIVESELLVSRKGDFSLFEPGGPRDADPIFGTFIPEDRRQSREELKAAAHGYFDSLINSDPARVRFHPDCNRVENGVLTTNGPRVGSSSCSEGVPRFSYMRGYHGLRFPVIDAARGLVMTALFFDMPMQDRTVQVRGETVAITAEKHHLPRSLYLFELFKIEDGRIKRVEAVMRNEAYGTDFGFGGESAEGPPLKP